MLAFSLSWENSLEISRRTGCLLISGSQVRALVRPPPSLQVSNSAGDTRICPANSGLFRIRPCLRVSLCKTKRRIWTLRLCIEKFRSRLGVRDRFDDWVVGLQFVPDYLHHPVSRYRTPRVIRAFVPRTAGFFEFVLVSASVSARQKGGSGPSSLHRKIPFPTRSRRPVR